MAHSQHLSEDGKHIPSVTEIPGLFKPDLSGFEHWICSKAHSQEDRCCIRARDEYSQEAAALGHDIHALRQAFLQGQSFDEGVPEYQAAVFEPVAQFYKESGYKPLYIEQKMTGKEFGGTLDGAGTFSMPFWEKQRKTFWKFPFNDGPELKLRPTINDIWIEDLKIKSKLDPLHPLQLYGYSLLLKECYGIEANWGLIIRREKKLHESPEIQLAGYYLPAYQKQWDAAMLMWKFLNE